MRVLRVLTRIGLSAGLLGAACAALGCGSASTTVVAPSGEECEISVTNNTPELPATGGNGSLAVATSRRGKCNRARHGRHEPDGCADRNRRHRERNRSRESVGRRRAARAAAAGAGADAGSGAGADLHLRRRAGADVGRRGE